jgi:hypothetical protein
MRAYPKKIRRLLREYTIEAYERELQRELTKVAASFTEWHKGALSSDELSHRVHEYDTGPSRRLYGQDGGPWTGTYRFSGSVPYTPAECEC